MKKLLVALLAVVMVLSVAAFNAAEAVDTVAMVFPGVVTDLAFNQFTYEGMVRAKEEGKIKDFAYVENVAQDEQVEYIRQFAAEGYDVVIGQGGQFGDALATVAEEFPETQFIFSVATDTYGLPNLTAATVSYSHAGYLAGVMAAYTTKSNKVAMITGEWYDPHRQMEASFYEGVKSVNPDIECTAVTTGDWADSAKAYDTAKAVIAQGYDVLFPCLDAAGAGVASAAQDATKEGTQTWIVGAVADYGETYGAQDVTVGNAIFNWEALGYVEATGEICDGQAHVIGMKDGGIQPNYSQLSEEGIAALEAAIEGLSNGTIDVHE